MLLVAREGAFYPHSGVPTRSRHSEVVAEMELLVQLNDFPPECLSHLEFAG